MRARRLASRRRLVVLTGSVFCEGTGSEEGSAVAGAEESGEG